MGYGFWPKYYAHNSLLEAENQSKQTPLLAETGTLLDILC